MNNRKLTALAVAVSLGALTAGCEKAAAPTAAALSEADAAAAADAAQAAWVTMDAAKVEAIYSPEIVGFDPIEPAMSTTWDNWHKLQQGFADMKFDKLTVPDRKIQILGPDTFVVSGTAQMTSTDGKMKAATLRFTDVYHKQADGRWLIVNEHSSLAPAAPAAATPAG